MAYAYQTPDIQNIICYLRRSRQDIERERKTGEDTLSTQRKIMNKILDDLSLPNEVVEEIGSGDKIETRPVFQQVLDWLRSGKYNAIAVKEIARLGRGSYADMGQIFDIIEQKRIYIVTPYKIYDIQNSADARQIRFELFFAREEFETIRERMLSSKLNLAHEGRWVIGATPFGYDLNSTTTRLEINEEQAQIVRMIFDLYVYGLPQPDGSVKRVGFNALGTYLNNHGIETPMKASGWKYGTLKRLITNVAYIGIFQYRKRRRVNNKYYDRPESEWITVEDAHEPIINREVWDLAQERYNGRQQPRVKQDFSPCELASLFICTKCGRRMVRQYNVQHYKKKDGEVSVYHKEFLWCTTNGCTFVKYRDVEEDLLNAMKQFNIVDVEVLKQIYRDRSQEHIKPMNPDNMFELIDKKRKEIKRKTTFLFEKFEAGFYEDNEFLERKKVLKKELEELDKLALEQSSGESPRLEQAVLDFKSTLKEVLEVYHTLSNKSKKNSLLTSVIDYVELTKTGKGTYDITVVPRLKI